LGLERVDFLVAAAQIHICARNVEQQMISELELRHKKKQQGGWLFTSIRIGENYFRAGRFGPLFRAPL